jgi:hypothetical protein
MIRLMPGDVVVRMVEGQAYAPTIDALRREPGLDRPAYVQYLDWMRGIVLHGDFGQSYWTRQPILDEFARRFPVTLELAALTILISVVIGVLVSTRACAAGSSERRGRPHPMSGREWAAPSSTASRHSRLSGRIGGIGTTSGAAVGSATASLRSVAAPFFMNRL